ncbi:accessory gene regulator B [Anaerobacterium chartisolvens]|uniref:Accessory gene regulator B n=1 Tax=Anaerobacterium chartisolvens TaxID=1297424 RepID=A0A369ALT9_9FIRM|nr:accessory gene regulator B family protein [Anaerobacterium chartisolvens]RCX10342.1 accessory gene regulator B [Anaerobacterium chartisolvens]
MRIIQKCSYACANNLTLALNENHQKRAVYYYGFQIVLGSVFKIIILVATGLLLGILYPLILISLCFAALRVLAGGYHMDSYGKCIVVSMVLFVLAGLLAGYTHMYWSQLHMAVLAGATFIAGLLTVNKYAPRDTPNKPITDVAEKRRFKTLSFIYLFVWLPVTLALIYFNLNMYAVSLCLGVLLELFSVSDLGHRFFDVIKNRLSYKKK